MQGKVLIPFKTIATYQLVTSVGNAKLHPLEVLLWLCPLATVQSLLCSYYVGEVNWINKNAGEEFRQLPNKETMMLLVLNGLLALAQNVSSFHTNKLAGPVTITVCANVKQAVTILLSIATFRINITLMNGVGMVMTLMSSAYYSWYNE